MYTIVKNVFPYFSLLKIKIYVKKTIFLKKNFVKIKFFKIKLFMSNLSNYYDGKILFLTGCTGFYIFYI